MHGWWQNLAAALVIHASPADMESIFINGEMAKENGKLLRIDWATLKHQRMDNIKELETRWKDTDLSWNTDELVEMWSMADKLE